MKRLADIKIRMLIICLFLGIPSLVQAQQDDTVQKQSKAYFKKAERAKKSGDFVEAEADYRRALARNEKNAGASYNFSHLYGDKKMSTEAMNQLLKTAKNSTDKALKHKAFHNMGNEYMRQEDYAQAVNAYKDALRNDPTDEETRYNLAIAKEMLEKNQSGDDDKDDQDDQEQNQDDENSKDNKDSQEQENNQDNQDNKDDQEQNQDQEDGEDQQDKQGEGENENDQNNDQDKQDDDSQDDKKDNRNGEQNPDEQDQQHQQPQSGISDEQAENLLKAAENLEKGVQQKINAEKGDKLPVNPKRKDW